MKPFNFRLFYILLVWAISINLLSIRSYSQAPATYSLKASYDTNLVFGTLKIFDDFIYGEASFSSASVDFGGTIFTNSGGISHLIYKMDTLGNIIWARQVEGIGASDFGFVTNDLQHHIYVGGHFENSLSVQGQTISSAGLRDIAVMKFDSSGNLMGLNKWGGVLSDTCFGLAVDYAQNYFMWMTNTGNYTTYTPTSNSYVLLKLDSNWNEVFIRWMRPAPYSQYPPTSILTNFGLCYSSGDSSLVFAGHFKSGFFEYRDSSGSFFLGNLPDELSDIASFVVKVNTDGHVLWNQVFEAYNDSHWVIGICVDDSSHVYVAKRWQWSLNGFGENSWTNFGKNGIYSIGLNESYQYLGYATGYPLQMNYSKGIVYALLYQERLLSGYPTTCPTTNTYAINWNTQANTFSYRAINLNYSQVVGFNGEFNFISENRLMSTCQGNCFGIPFNLSLPHELRICGTDTSELPQNCNRIEGGSGGYSYHWSPGIGLSDSTVLEPKFLSMPPSTITYTLTVMDAQGNSISDTIRVSRNSNPSVTVTRNPLFPTCANAFDILVYGDTSYTNEIRWDNNSAFKDSLHISISTSTIFHVITTDTNQCKVSNDVNIYLQNNSHNQSVYLYSYQLPYYWDGQNCNIIDQFYVHNYTNSAGCDSNEVLYIGLRSAYFRTIDTLVCSSNFPFTWRGKVINQPGSYNDTLFYYSLDSIITLNVAYKVINTIINSLTDTVCANTPFDLLAQTSPSYCTPIVQNLDTTYYINEVNLNNGAILNYSGMDSSGYHNYSSLSAHLNTGQYYPLIVNCNVLLVECQAWIDFDQNGEFSSLERVSFNYDYANIYIPFTAISGYTRMRIACKHYEGTNLPCYNDGTGEYEDYAIYIHGGVEKYTWYPNSSFANFQGDSVEVQGIDTTTIFTVNALYDNNCFLNVSKTIYVKDSSLQVFVDTICSNDLPYLWEGDTLLNSGVYSKQFTNILGCDSTLVLNLQVNVADSILVNDTICSNQLPYIWQGMTIISSGVYTNTLTKMNGCDSVMMLSLQVYSIDSMGFADTICSNQLPYVWQGQNINSSGTYSVTYQNKYGCDSILNLFLTIWPVTTEILTDTICSNLLPYYWLGDTIVSSGAYTHVMTNTSGCDSILILNLQVNVTDSILVSDTVCSNQLPYIWQGMTIISSGVYTNTLTKMNGCDSVMMLSLQVYSIDSMGFADTICSNQLPYVWQGQNINSSGIYSVTFQNKYGCDSILNLFLTIWPVTTEILSDTICSNLLPYYWLGDTIVSSGIYTHVMTNTSGCDSIVILNLQVNVADSILVSDTICSNQLPYIWQGMTIISSGVYTNTLTKMNGCDSVMMLSLQVYSIDSMGFADTICSNQLPYVWQGQNINSSGTYSVTFQNKYGCDSILNLFLTIWPVTTEILTDTICSNQLPYYWLGDTIVSSGIYTHVFANTSGCDSTLILNLQVYLSDTLGFNDTICSNQLPYIWQGNSYTSSGVYSKLFQNEHGCNSLLNLFLTVNSIDSVTMLDTICSNQLPYSWQGQVIASSGSYTAKYQNAGGCDSILNLNLTVYPSYNSMQYDTICSNDLPYQWQQHSILSAGIYLDTLQSALHCDSILSLNLIVYDNYHGQLIQDGNQLFSPWKNLLNYKWYYNGSLLNSIDTSLLITEAGNYELRAESDKGCEVKFYTTVLEESFTSLHIYPNPTNTIFNIDYDLYLSSTVHFTLLDLAGNVIKVVSSASKLNPGRHHIEFSISDLNLSNGIYFLQRNDDSGSWVEKVSIVR